MLRAVLILPLPGPTRKRTEALYRFRLLHLDPSDGACRQLWQIDGGRAVYQVSLSAEGQWACTCAAASYDKTGRPCKHVRALQLFVSPDAK